MISELQPSREVRQTFILYFLFLALALSTPAHAALTAPAGCCSAGFTPKPTAANWWGYHEAVIIANTSQYSDPPLNPVIVQEFCQSPGTTIFRLHHAIWDRDCCVSMANPAHFSCYDPPGKVSGFSPQSVQQIFEWTGWGDLSINFRVIGEYTARWRSISTQACDVGDEDLDIEIPVKIKDPCLADCENNISGPHYALNSVTRGCPGPMNWPPQLAWPSGDSCEYIGAECRVQSTTPASGAYHYIFSLAKKRPPNLVPHTITYEGLAYCGYDPYCIPVNCVAAENALWAWSRATNCNYTTITQVLHVNWDPNPYSCFFSGHRHRVTLVKRDPCSGAGTASSEEKCYRLNGKFLYPSDFIDPTTGGLRAVESSEACDECD